MGLLTFVAQASPFLSKETGGLSGETLSVLKGGAQRAEGGSHALGQQPEEAVWE